MGYRSRLLPEYIREVKMRVAAAVFITAAFSASAVEIGSKSVPITFPFAS